MSEETLKKGRGRKKQQQQQQPPEAVSMPAIPAAETAPKAKGRRTKAAVAPAPAIKLEEAATGEQPLPAGWAPDLRKCAWPATAPLHTCAMHTVSPVFFCAGGVSPFHNAVPAHETACSQFTTLMTTSCPDWMSTASQRTLLEDCSTFLRYRGSPSSTAKEKGSAQGKECESLHRRSCRGRSDGSACGRGRCRCCRRSAQEAGAAAQEGCSRR